MAAGNSETQPLRRPYRLRDLQLVNRVVVAPLTSARAENAGLVPTELHARYYAQTGLGGADHLLGNLSQPSSVGWNDAPGLLTGAQVSGWRAVTDAVHRAREVIFAQLWHTGSVSHPDFFVGGPSLARRGLTRCSGHPGGAQGHRGAEGDDRGGIVAISGPVTAGSIIEPANIVPIDLPANGYVGQEFFVSGQPARMTRRARSAAMAGGWPRPVVLLRFAPGWWYATWPTRPGSAAPCCWSG